MLRENRVARYAFSTSMKKIVNWIGILIHTPYQKISYRTSFLINIFDAETADFYNIMFKVYTISWHTEYRKSFPEIIVVKQCYE